MQDPSDIQDDEPMTLAEACEIIFRGAIKPATLKAEAARGNLVIERIGRRHFVTRATINAMRERCRVTRPVPRATFIPTGDYEQLVKLRERQALEEKEAKKRTRQASQERIASARNAVLRAAAGLRKKK